MVQFRTFVPCDDAPRAPVREKSPALQSSTRGRWGIWWPGADADVDDDVDAVAGTIRDRSGRNADNPDFPLDATNALITIP